MASPFFTSAAEATGANAAATSPSVAPATNDLNQAASEEVCRKLPTASIAIQQREMYAGS